MATKKLSDYFTLPASGGVTSMFGTAPKSSPFMFGSSPKASPVQAPVSGPMSVYNPATAYNAPAAPVVPARAPVAPSAAPIFTPSAGGTPRAPAGPQGATGAAPASQNPTIDPRWLRTDGSIKTPDEIASEVGGTLRTINGAGDVGTLAAEQFAGGPATTVDAEAEARRIGNARNDIASGAADPYKVGADSGIAYTPAELKAIENAYAGIYDPALDTALAKVNAKQAEDNLRLSAQLEAQAKAGEGFTLGKDQVRYDAQGNPIAVGLSDPTGVSVYVAGQDPAADAYVKGFNDGTYKASDIPDAYKGLVAQGAAQTKPVRSKAATEAVSNIESLLLGDLEKVTGLSNLNPLTFVPGSDTAPLRNLLSKLAGTLALKDREALKGSGAISDFEFRVLQQAASAMGVNDNGTSNLSAEDLKTELKKLQLKLQVGPTELTDEQLIYLQNTEGMSPDEIREYSQYQSFSSVGNTTASTVAKGAGNRPQRNFNPGNVKAGGLADSLAIGTDDQDHLIFPDAQTGFKALAADLTAKVNGGSRHLPPNPTIEQLGKVYAEDGTWGKKVAALLGVPVGTHTQAIPMSDLMKAVATQEGFYA